MLSAIIAMALQSPSTSADARSAPACVVDRPAILALDEAAFDQGQSGWRLLSRPGCYMAAADLIAEWRAAHPAHSTVVRWHEGQMRAAAGDYSTAITLFDSARHPPNELRVDFGWNLYVDASIAFLRRDRRALLEARNALASLPRPADQPGAAPEARTIAFRGQWPPNLSVVNALVACFDHSYADIQTGHDCTR